ncbi:iron permease [Flagelloscypha sp. PMI_526]|nr:iron permease [Flagelloscypha sp. PMI_526]
MHRPYNTKRPAHDRMGHPSRAQKILHKIPKPPPHNVPFFLLMVLVPNQNVSPEPPSTVHTLTPDSPLIHTSTAASRKSREFWFSFSSVLLVTCLWALDLTAIATIVPAISKDLNGSGDFAWIGIAYALASTAIRPLICSLADIFGRRFVILLSVSLFALGSALAGCARNMAWIIGARTVQGLGGGGIATLIDVITADLVPLNERGLYEGYISLAWAGTSAIGPIVAGSLAERASWRWLFYLNLPICALCIILVTFFLAVNTPPGSILTKLNAVDWTGNLIVISGITFTSVGLAWAGVRYPWSDIHVSVPLTLGLALLVIFFLHQRYITPKPTIPWDIICNQTALSGFLTAFIHGIVSISLIYYMPIYFQAVLSASPIRSGIDSLPTALLIAPMALFNGIAVQLTQRYLPGNYIGWILTVTGFGILSMLKVDSSTSEWIGYQIVVAAGVGILYNATIFPALAALPVEKTARIVGFQNFMISFAQTWGITISATILQNRLQSTLPIAFMKDYLTDEVDIAISLISTIPSLPEGLRDEVRAGFASSMSTIWKIMGGLSGMGLLLVLLMREIPMRDMTDPMYALKEAG